MMSKVDPYASLIRERQKVEFPRAPAMGILTRTRTPAPRLDLDIFGPWWAAWIEAAAAAANAAADYVALPLLCSGSALIGNARWVVAWPGWDEPPSLWGASVGDASSGKSPGANAVIRNVLRQVEAHMGRDYAAQLATWKEEHAVAQAVYKQWEKDVAAAIKKRSDPPDMPRSATSPPKPVRPRAQVKDTTVEALAEILRDLPKGVLHARDELAGWLMNLSRYNGGSDRPFWLEAFVGGAMEVDRKNNPETLFIPHLSVPVFGTIQPDRLKDLLTGVDDGLAARFLWSWPEARPFRRPPSRCDADVAARALMRLADLAMARTADGRPVPSYIHLSAGGSDIIERFAQRMQVEEQSAGRLLKSAIGKARGQAIRLAIVLHYLRWSVEDDGAELLEVSADAMQSAVNLMTDYFLPMARRVLGDAAVSKEERNAQTLARWIVEAKPEQVNVSAIRDQAHLDGLRESDPVKAACQFLVEAGFLAIPTHTGPGRPRGDYLVNPELWVSLGR